MFQGPTPGIQSNPPDGSHLSVFRSPGRRITGLRGLMRRFLRRNIPSMFERRLLLLGLVLVGVGVGLGAKTAWLTLGAKGQRALQDAENLLLVAIAVPTVRGRILDRKGRVLAVDAPGWDIAVNYGVIIGAWAFDQARTAARKENEQRWVELDAVDREALIARHRRPYDEQVEMLWQTLARLGGVDKRQIDDRKNTIIRRVQNEASYLWAVWRQQRIAALQRDVPLTHVVQPIEQQQQAHSILEDVADQTRLKIQSYIREAERNEVATDRGGVQDGRDKPMQVWRQVEIQRPKHRRYRLETMTKMVDRAHLPVSLNHADPKEITIEGVGIHVLGLMRNTLKEDEQRRPYNRKSDLGGYQAGDRTGSFGIERSREYHLRGARGHDVYHRDRREKFRLHQPVPGRDAHLTIDIHLQARIQAIMSPQFGLMQVHDWHRSKAAKKGKVGHRLNGAAVVLDVQTAEVLAAVSMPAMELRLVRDDPDKIYKDPLNLPYLNRAVARQYPPGSTIKPLMLVSAVSSGVHNLYSPIECTGVLDPDQPTKNRCWIFKKYMLTHQSMEAVRSLEVSCNIYYFTLGRRMGVQRTVDWYSKFGLGTQPCCGLWEHIEGDLPDPVGASRASAIQMGIGQGPVGWTPLQAAAAYATLARGGIYLTPTFLRSAGSAEERHPIDLHLDAAALGAALEGLDRVLSGPEGTARHLAEGEPIINIDRVKVYAKSGTADPGHRRWVDLNFDNKRDKGEFVPVVDDHAWFVALVQPEGELRPTHAIAVIVEYAGSGSRVAGPIANQIIVALRQEGYLP